MFPSVTIEQKLHSNSDKGDGSVKYILTGEGAGTIFIIDDTTGDIHSTKSLDREQKTHYVLHAQAIDRRTNKPLEPESEFIIKVQDINDNAPKFTDGPYIVTVPEMSDMGTSVLQVTATDADDPTYGNSARVVYSILQGQPYFSVDPKTDIPQKFRITTKSNEKLHAMFLAQSLERYRTSSTMLNKNGESGYPCLAPSMRGKGCSFFLLSIVEVPTTLSSPLAFHLVFSFWYMDDAILDKIVGDLILPIRQDPHIPRLRWEAETWDLKQLGGGE
ncbi:cadherin-18-like [Panthera uncia]|uniref:cadherin-18-like n=1 Tax=Panthera uncia TaxID=29064 RepID=UPI0020FFBE0F|nr:cadherin-18-like [Panthera uncia]